MQTIIRDEKKRETIHPVVPPIRRDGNGRSGWGGGIPHSSSNYSIPIEPAKLALWLFIAASIMLFAAFTSAYIVRASVGDWVRINIPLVMWIGTGILLLSSVTMQFGYHAVKSGKLRSFKRAILLTALLGGIFVVAQISGWFQLRETGLYVSTNPASSFFYMITITHAVHLIGGLTALCVIAGKAFLGAYNATKYLGVELGTIYWHFLDFLWLYLILFLTIV